MSLIQFCKDGDLERVKAALKSGTHVNTKDEYGQTGLTWAVSKKHNSVVALLLNIPNIDATMSLIQFCKDGDLEVVSHPSLFPLFPPPPPPPSNFTPFTFLSHLHNTVDKVDEGKAEKNYLSSASGPVLYPKLSSPPSSSTLSLLLMSSVLLVSTSSTSTPPSLLTSQ